MNNQMQTSNGHTLSQKPSALAVMASRLSVDPAKMLATLKDTCFKGANDSELLALVVVANEYQLNPLLRELYAFPKKGGGIVPVVGVDGWTRIVTRHPDFDGVSFKFDLEQDGKPIACTATMRVKNRALPVEVTEYYDECYRETDPWRTMPKRMLRHRAFIQAARLAFAISGIVDEDEAGTIIDVTPQPAPAPEAQPEPPRRGRPPGSKNKPADPTEPAPTPAPASTPQLRLAEALGQFEITAADFSAWAQQAGHIEQPLTEWEAVPTEVAERLLRVSKTVANEIMAMKGGAQ
jgi:phage recombination protein Bet